MHITLSFIILKSRLKFQHEYIHFLIAAALRQAAQQLVYNATKTSGLHWRLGLAPESKHFCYLLQMQTFYSKNVFKAT